MCGIVGYAGSKQVGPVDCGLPVPVVATRDEGDADIARDVEHVIYTPQTTDLPAPVIEVIPMQLLADAMAVRRGCDVDQPRNLAKSAIVE